MGTGDEVSVCFSQVLAKVLEKFQRVGTWALVSQRNLSDVSAKDPVKDQAELLAKQLTKQSDKSSAKQTGKDNRVLRKNNTLSR